MRPRCPAALFAAALLCILFSAAPSFAAIRNLTEENRSSLDKKIAELRQTELLRMTRGRIKPSPVLLPFFTSYQTLLLDRNMLLDSQLKDYSSALAEISRAKKDFSDFASAGLGDAVVKLFDARLIDAYSVSDDIAKAQSMWEVWTILSASRIRLQTLPVELRLALNAGKWMQRAAPAGIPGGTLDKYLALCRGDALEGEEAPAHADVFAADAHVNNVSTKYSELLLGLSGQGGTASP